MLSFSIYFSAQSQTEPACTLNEITMSLWDYSDGTSSPANATIIPVCTTQNCYTTTTLCLGDLLEIDAAACPYYMYIYPSSSTFNPISTFNSSSSYPIVTIGNLPTNNAWSTIYTPSVNGSQAAHQPVNNLPPGTYWLAFKYSAQTGPWFVELIIDEPLSDLNAVICKGENAVLTPQGCGMGYFNSASWYAGASTSIDWNYNGTLVTTTNLTLPSLQANTSGTYTLNYYSHTGLHSFTAPFSVTTEGPSVPVLTALPLGCVEDILTLANYNTNYSYSNTVFINGSACTACTISPVNSSGQFTITYPFNVTGSVQLTTTATETGNQSPFPCSQSNTWNYSLDCCTKPGVPSINNTSASAYFGSTSVVNNATYVINGNFIVNQNLDFSNCHLYFGMDAAIIVQPGFTLKLKNGCLLEACGDDMWSGIELKAGSDFNSLGNTVIKDAKRAVESKEGANFFIYSTTFENNLTGIFMGPYNGSHPGRYHTTSFNRNGPLKNSGTSNQTTIGVEILRVQSCRLGAMPCNANHD